ncbi:MAG TPA: hypothetical protein DCL21_01310 [Alphaproteobacteria bacterium]|nr:hypothetical protein [Alphaproteobacteria bacterium]
MIDYNLLDKEVRKVLEKDKTGHSMDHIYKVLKNANRLMDLIAKDHDKDIVKVACYLHDVDDYKIVGEEESQKLTNTHRILSLLDMTQEQKKHVVTIMNSIGLSKQLDDVHPSTLEGTIVSDADKLDLGANGIVRTFEYGFHVNRPVFDVNILPVKHKSSKEYKGPHRPSINHFFERLLIIKDLMYNQEARKLAEKRHKIAYDFLENFFEERHEDCSKWLELLAKYK